MNRTIGMLFSDGMVRAILNGKKDQTRRVVTPQPWKNGTIQSGPAYFWQHGKPATEFDTDYIHTDERTVKRWVEKFAPYQAGDTLYVRECAMLGSVGPGKREVTVKYRATNGYNDPHNSPLDFDIPEGKPNPFSFTRWTPGIHMPQWASRIRLTVLLVQVERVHEMSFGDAQREGVGDVREYEILWGQLNAERGYGWKTNPWVYVVTFKVAAISST